MRVAAEFEHCEDALAAHRLLIDENLDPEDIEIRSPYPLPEAPIPPHRERPFHMRTAVRIMWGTAIILGFSFIAYTQLDWKLRTDGHPIVAVPINALLMYEMGMITAILTTTFMFLWETRHFRKLVPPLEEDLPVAHGHVVVVVDGKSADRAHTLLQNRGARSVVTYLLLVGLGLVSTGCGTWPYNMRAQVVNKPGETLKPYTNPNAELGEVAPADLSLVMPVGDATLAPAVFQNLTPGDPRNTMTDALTALRGLDPTAADYAQKLSDFRTQMPAWLQIKALVMSSASLGKPEFLTAGKDSEDVVDRRYRVELNELMGTRTGPVPRSPESGERGKVLYQNNCSFCHGANGTSPGPVGELTQVPPPAIGNGQIYSQPQFTDGYLYLYIALGKNAMPPFVTKLTARDIWDIVNHLRDLQGAPR
ncbi:MAG: hypothetical protein AMXMBFR33_05550 [Candidatus Xenobia bacterium]|jgi:cytochrome c553